MDSEQRPPEQSTPGPAPAEPTTGRRGKRGVGSKLEEGRQTFQPGLWSRLIGIGVVLVYLLLFAVLNTRHVRVSFVFASTTVSLIWVILLALGIGLVLGVLASQLHRFRMRHPR
jgi:uncharacterized integral membrane protein